MLKLEATAADSQVNVAQQSEMVASLCSDAWVDVVVG